MDSRLVLKADLVHSEQGCRVVQVSAWQGERCLGSSLGEAETAEQAEDRALKRLQERLQLQPMASAAAAPATEESSARTPRQAPIRMPIEAPVTEAPVAVAAAAAPAQPSEQPQPEQPVAAPTRPAPEPAPEPAADPEDWSEELAEIDVQLQRIGWDRNQEGIYLQRAFGHPNRNRLTAYADLVSYLRSLRSLVQASDPNSAIVPLRRRDLLQQSDQLLASLQWDAGRGRQLLDEQFRLSSRQQLSDEQLLQFNMLLEEALLEQHPS